MIGILLAGGNGTRLDPLTRVTNKHLLPVYDRPMIYYPIQTLLDSGITDILIVTGKNHMGDVMELLGSGEQFGADFTYKIQDKPNGIAGAILTCEHLIRDQPFAVILGDNIFHDMFKQDTRDFRYGAKVFLNEVPHPERFGVATISEGKITAITEKPINPQSNLAVTGFYLFDKSYWYYALDLRPSKRGELEITDINNRYIQDGTMKHRILDGFWSDAGTFDSLQTCSDMQRHRVQLTVGP
jgi:glucose-1-phosphate thymidylyltransferase